MAHYGLPYRATSGSGAGWGPGLASLPLAISPSQRCICSYYLVHILEHVARERRRPVCVQDLLDPLSGDVDPSEIGFPLPVDKSRYTKRIEIVYKETPQGPLHLDAYRPVLADGDRVPLVVMIHGGGWHQGGRFEMGLTRWAGWSPALDR